MAEQLQQRHDFIRGHRKRALPDLPRQHPAEPLCQRNPLPVTGRNVPLVTWPQVSLCDVGSEGVGVAFGTSTLTLNATP